MSLHRTDLDDEPGIAHGLHNSLGLGEGRGEGLFNEDVLAGTEALDRCRCMEPVGGGNDDRFDARVVEKRVQ